MSTEGQQPSDFPSTPEGWAKRFTVEFDAAKKALEGWRKEAEEADKAFRDEVESLNSAVKRRTIFTANVTTQAAMLFGNTPKSDVTRRFADPKDDVARVAGELLERLLNTDLERASDTSEEAFRNALMDRLVPGGCVTRCRYEADFEELDEEELEARATPAKVDEETGAELSPAVPYVPGKTREEACIDYVHHTDLLWSKARVWSEVEWVAFAAEMTRAGLVKRFGAAVGSVVPLNAKPGVSQEEADKDPYARARVWELWHKPTKKVFWFVEGHSRVLDEKDDPLQLEAFFPCPKPWLANVTTSKLVPKSDYAINKGLYDSINTLTVRIDLIRSAIRVAGVYNRDAGDAVKQLLNGKAQNVLIPVENWALFGEKGGVKGQVDWLPMDQCVAALQVLVEQRRDEIDALYQDSGFSDIMRGQATQAGATATEQAAKTRFGSVRMQKMQDEFARFVTDAHRIKAEIICKHFEPQTILERANAAYGYESPELVQQAVQLLKSEYYCYRIEVKPESVALADFAALRSEKTEVIDAVSGFLQRMAPLLQMLGPQGLPFLIELLQAGVAGLKGAATMEGILDRAAEAAKQAQQQAAANPQPQQQDPKLQAEQLKAQTAQLKVQGDMQKENAKLQGDLVRIQAETQAKAQQEQVQRQENVRESAEKIMVQRALNPREPPKPGGLP